METPPTEIVLTAGERRLILERKSMEARCSAEWRMVCNVAILNGGGDANGTWELEDDDRKLVRKSREVRMQLEQVGE